LAYDASGRITNVVNALGNFNYAYDGATTRVLDETLPDGQTTHFDYFNNTADRRLQKITHRKPDTSLISRFTYAYNTPALITNLLQESSVATNNWSLVNDAADQLIGVLVQNGAGPIAWTYNYDSAGNRSLVQSNAASVNYYFNSLNELLSASDASL